MDYFKTLDTFVRVAKLSSFSAAAAEIGLSRAMISNHINALENRVGVALFNRTTRHVALTETGRRYYSFATRILGELADEELSLATLHKNPAGSLRIVAPRSFGNLHLGTALAQFCLANPEFHVTLLLTDSLLMSKNEIDGEEFDVALQLAPPARVTSIGRQIASLRWAVCAAPQYLKQYGRPKEPSDLLNHNCLVNAANFPDRYWRFGSSRRHRTIKLKGNFSGNVITMRDAAIAGLGVALLPLYCADEALRDGKLVRILENYTLPETPLYVLIRGNKYMPRKVRMLTSFLAKWARTIN